MTIRQNPKRGEAAPTAPTPNVARFVSKASSQYALDAAGSTEYRPHTAVDAAGVGPKTVLLFEQMHRGDVWRLEVCEHEGRIFNCMSQGTGLIERGCKSNHAGIAGSLSPSKRDSLLQPRRSYAGTKGGRSQK